MGFGGSAQAMINIIKNNRAMLGEKKSFFKSKKDYYASNSVDENQDVFVDHLQATPALLEDIRAKLQRERKMMFRINLIIFIILLLLAVFSVTYFFGGQEEIEVKSKKMVIKVEDTRVKDFVFYIDDGDEWMEQGKFENGLFQYKKAAELAPSNYNVQYRISLAYAYLCRYDNIDCEKGKLAFEEAKKNFPDAEELLELSVFFTQDK